MLCCVKKMLENSIQHPLDDFVVKEAIFRTTQLQFWDHRSLVLNCLEQNKEGLSLPEDLVVSRRQGIYPVNSV